MRISDWSADVCSSDLVACDARQAGKGALAAHRARNAERAAQLVPGRRAADDPDSAPAQRLLALRDRGQAQFGDGPLYLSGCRAWPHHDPFGNQRSEEHTSELQSLMRISYAVFCLKKNTKQKAPKKH